MKINSLKKKKKKQKPKTTTTILDLDRKLYDADNFDLFRM